MYGAEALTHHRANLLPHRGAAKLRKLAGEYGIDGERHLDEHASGLDIFLVGSGILRLLGKRLGDHAQRFCPGRLIDVTADEFEDPSGVAIHEAHKLRAEIGCGVVLLELLMLELKRCLWILDTFENVMAVSAVRTSRAATCLMRPWPARSRAMRPTRSLASPSDNETVPRRVISVARIFK